MLDIKFIRENQDFVEAGAKKKHIDFDIKELIKIDDKRRDLLKNIEAKRAEQNLVGEKIAKAGDEEKKKLLIEMKALKAQMGSQEDDLKDVMKKWQALMLMVPNIPDMTVPDGASDAENREIKTWGNIPNFDFEVKNHIELSKHLDIADFERGVKVSGFRGYFLKNEGALLSFAIWQFALNEMIKDGFTPFIAPTLVKKECLLGTGYLPQGEDDLYKTQDGDYLAGTSEVALMSYFSDEVFPKKDVFKKFVAFSPCFRREAGSHGKDTQGLMRVHEFYKIEQFVLCEASHELSQKLHEDITRNAENLMQKLEIPYRVVVNCGGDLGLGQVKKYDIESWIPSEKKYRETHSSSYFHDFQTRRLNIRYRDDHGKLRFAHSLNSTAFATPRLLISIIENNQEKDGSVRVPKALVPFMGKEVIKR